MARRREKTAILEGSATFVMLDIKSLSFICVRKRNVNDSERRNDLPQFQSKNRELETCSYWHNHLREWRKNKKTIRYAFNSTNVAKRETRHDIHQHKLIEAWWSSEPINTGRCRSQTFVLRQLNFQKSNICEKPTKDFIPWNRSVERGNRVLFRWWITLHY